MSQTFEPGRVEGSRLGHEALCSANNKIKNSTNNNNTNNNNSNNNNTLTFSIWHGAVAPQRPNPKPLDSKQLVPLACELPLRGLPDPGEVSGRPFGRSKSTYVTM